MKNYTEKHHVEDVHQIVLNMDETLYMTNNFLKATHISQWDKNRLCTRHLYHWFITVIKRLYYYYLKLQSSVSETEFTMHDTIIFPDLL